MGRLLVALGLGHSQHDVREGWKISVSICADKMFIQRVVWSLARLIGLPLMGTRVVVLLSSIAVGVNAYIMSRQFKELEGPLASSLVLSTGLAALTTTLALTLTGL